MELVYENPASIKRQVPKAIIDQQQQQQMMAANNAAMSAHQHNGMIPLAVSLQDSPTRRLNILNPFVVLLLV